MQPWWLLPLALGIAFGWLFNGPPAQPICIDVPLITGENACP